MLEIGSRYKTGYLFLSLSLPLSVALVTNCYAAGDTRGVYLILLRAIQAILLHLLFFFLSTTAVNRSHWLFDHSIALIAHGDTFSRE